AKSQRKSRPEQSGWIVTTAPNPHATMKGLRRLDQSESAGIATAPAMPPTMSMPPTSPACSESIPCGARIGSSHVVSPLKTPRPRKASAKSVRSPGRDKREANASGGSPLAPSWFCSFGCTTTRNTIAAAAGADAVAVSAAVRQRSGGDREDDVEQRKDEDERARDELAHAVAGLDRGQDGREVQPEELARAGHHRVRREDGPAPRSVERAHT